jgi:hypothetical protein
MTKLQKQIESLTKSIEKWDNIVNQCGADLGSKNCQCCIDYFADFDVDGTMTCIGCPIYEKTGKPMCENTPYTHWVEQHGNAFTLHLFGTVARSELEISAAKSELIFLTELLKELKDEQYG